MGEGLTVPMPQRASRPQQDPSAPRTRYGRSCSGRCRSQPVPDSSPDLTPRRPVRKATGLRDGPAGLRRFICRLRLAASALVLDLARAAQGAAAAVVTASGLALLASIYPPAERGRALGISGAIAALSFVVGPLVGGVLTEVLGWRSVFIANVPVAALLTGRAVLPELCSRSTVQDALNSITPASQRSPSGSAHCCTPHSGAVTSDGRRPRSRWPPWWGWSAWWRSWQSSVERSMVSSTSACSAIERSPVRLSRPPWPERPTSACSST